MTNSKTAIDYHSRKFKDKNNKKVPPRLALREVDLLNINRTQNCVAATLLKRILMIFRAFGQRKQLQMGNWYIL